jgi:alpha-glucosidase (family GH31 glycosyl hydrolase)
VGSHDQVLTEYRDKDFKQFIKNLHDRGQRYIPLLDAGIYKPAGKEEHYEPYESGSNLGVFLKEDGGREYQGYVWCGKTVWPDWTHHHTAEWWHKCLAKFKETVDFDGLWLDMNEPANLPVASDKWLNTKAVITVNGRRVADLGQNIWDYPPYAVSSS